jgi:hypothetical protein
LVYKWQKAVVKFTMPALPFSAFSRFEGFVSGSLFQLKRQFKALKAFAH